MIMKLQDRLQGNPNEFVFISQWTFKEDHSSPLSVEPQVCLYEGYHPVKLELLLSYSILVQFYQQLFRDIR